MDNNNPQTVEGLLHDETLINVANAVELLEETPNEADETDESARKIASLTKQVDELKDKYLRQAAEFENYKRRAVRERIETIQTASRDTLSALLPILDDFDRASKNEEFTEGVNLVHQKLLSVVASKGLKTMETPAGTDFDTDQHEAIAEIPAGDALVGKIVDTVESGYLLNEKIIRYAKVVVGK